MLDQDFGIQILLESEVWTGFFQGEFLGGRTEFDGKDKFHPHLQEGEAYNGTSGLLLEFATKGFY